MIRSLVPITYQRSLNLLQIGKEKICVDHTPTLLKVCSTAGSYKESITGKGHPVGMIHIRHTTCKQAILFTYSLTISKVHRETLLVMVSLLNAVQELLGGGGGV